MQDVRVLVLSSDRGVRRAMGHALRREGLEVVEDEPQPGAWQRWNDAPGQRLLKVPGLTLDLEGYRVWVGGVDAGLRPKEFDLLLLLARHPGQVFSRGQILEQV